MTDSQQAKEIVTGFIEHAKWEVAGSYEYRLAGLLRETWTAKLLRCNYKICVRVARFVLMTLPSERMQRMGPNDQHTWDQATIRAWENDANLLLNNVCDRQGKFWWREGALILSGVQLVANNAIQLSLDMLYERPDIRHSVMLSWRGGMDE